MAESDTQRFVKALRVFCEEYFTLERVKFVRRTIKMQRRARAEHCSVETYALRILSKYAHRIKIAIKYYTQMKIIRRQSLLAVSEIGFGYKECVYREALARRLIEQGFRVSSEVTTPIIDEGEYLSNVSDKVDILVNDSIVLELKTSSKILQKHVDQLHRYFRGNLRRKVGMVICFKDASSIVPCKPVMFRTLLVRD